MNRQTLTLVCLALLASLAGCAEEQKVTATQEKDLPPSFLDEAPPLPTSATEILGGGTLVMPDGSFVEDSLIVITDGKLVAWGPRGEVEVPNDSIGHDLRGKWIQAAALEVGALADLRFSERTRGMNEVNQTLNGYYKEGTLDLPSD